MRRPVTRGVGIAVLLAGMMGAMGASSQGTSRFDMNRHTATRNETKKKRQQIGTGRHWRSWGHPAAPQNQRQFRKKWRMSPHYRPKANKR